MFVLTSKSKIIDKLHEIENYINALEDSKDEVYKQLKEYNKDSEIQKLQTEIAYIKKNSIHIMSNKEKEFAKQFKEEHLHKYDERLGFSYIVTPTGIGNGLNIRCNQCEEEKDITDYENW